jgi:hypothetical protein
MIGGIFFLGSIIAIFIILNWFVRNDAVPEDKPTQGFLAMKMPEPESKKRGPRRWTREDALRR